MTSSAREFGQEMTAVNRGVGVPKAAGIGIAIGVLSLLSSGCIMIAGDQLPDINPQVPEIPPPTIEQSVGDFSFHLDGGKMISSNKAGRNVNISILNHWKKRGFITRHTYVKSSEFTGSADYNLVLGGHQEGDSNAGMQFLSGLTLFLLPYSVNTQLDLMYTLEHVDSGREFEAKASDSFRSVTQLFLFPISPFAMGGMTRTYERLANHLFDQLAKQGAFKPVEPPASPAETPAITDVGRGSAEQPAGRSVEERLHALQQLHEQGIVTDEEYESKKLEILREF